MKLRQVAFGVAGIIGLLLAFELGRHLQSPSGPARALNNRRITISASPDKGKCEVDFPVALVSKSAHTVQWTSNDNPYWVSFLTIKPPAVAPPYTPENPLDGDPVYVDASHPSNMYKIKVNATTKYYYYAIYDHDPKGDNSNPCKDAGDDHDTGLNVKP